MSIELLELIENFHHSELGVGMADDAFTKYDELTIEQLDLISSHINAWDTQLHERLARPIDRSQSTVNFSNDAGDEDVPASAMYKHPYNGLDSLHVDQIKRQLLLFPRIAIVRPDLQCYGDRTERIQAFKHFISPLLELKELLKDGVIELTPLSGFYSNEIEGGAGLVRKACESDPGIRLWLQAQTDIITDFSESARRRDPYFDAGIRILSALTYGYRMVATHPFVGALYERLLCNENTADRATTSFVRNLYSINIPGLTGLDWRDVRAIRQDEDCFRKWRAELKNLIAAVDPELEPMKYIDRFNSLAKARLEIIAHELNQELRKSSALTHALSCRTSFAIVAVAAAATLTTFGVSTNSDMWTELLKIVETAGVTAGLQFLWATKQSSGQKALRSHYAIFSSK